MKYRKIILSLATSVCSITTTYARPTQIATAYVEPNPFPQITKHIPIECSKKIFTNECENLLNRLEEEREDAPYVTKQDLSFSGSIISTYFYKQQTVLDSIEYSYLILDQKTATFPGRPHFYSASEEFDLKMSRIVFERPFTIFSAPAGILLFLQQRIMEGKKIKIDNRQFVYWRYTFGAYEATNIIYEITNN